MNIKQEHIFDAKSLNRIIRNFFERNRMSYYDSLSMVKQTNNITQ